MGSDTKIEWTDASWTPIRAHNLATDKIGWHCEKVSAGCKNCYAGPINRRLGTGLDYKPGHQRDIAIFLDETMLLAPLKWRRPRRIFVCSMTDLFADFVTDAMIDCVFAAMALAPQHTFQVLTKRPERMRAYVSDPWVEERVRDVAAVLLRRRFEIPDAVPAELLAAIDPLPWPLPHVWLGVSAEDQEAADARVPVLLATPAAVRFVSVEPMLGPVDLTPHLFISTHEDAALLEGPDEGPPPVLPFRDPATTHPDDIATPRLNWVIVGGESGPGARPMHPDWARSLRDQCAAAGVAFHFKQWGEWVPAVFSGQVLESRGGGQPTVAWPDGTIARGKAEDKGGPGTSLFKVGKKGAGRLLDGVQHDGVPA